MGNCVCGDNFGLLGLLDCSITAGKQVGDIFVPTYDSDNQQNGILIDDISADGDGGFKLPETTVIGNFDTIDRTKGWNGTPNLIDSITPARTDAKTYTSSEGDIFNLEDGVQTVSYELPNVPLAYANQFDASSCIEMSTYQKTNKGQIIGVLSDDDLSILPLKIQTRSLRAVYFPATDDKPCYVAISYQVSKLVDESRLVLISANEMEADILSVRSSIDATISQGDGTNTATKIFVKLDSSFQRSAKKKTPITGADVVSDWIVEDASGTDLNPSIVDEVVGSDGEYEITIDATSGSVPISVSYKTTRTSVTDLAFVAQVATITSAT